jgi:hypothetical protein
MELTPSSASYMETVSRTAICWGVACVVANDDFVLLIVSLKEDVIKTENLTCEEFENVSLMNDYGFERKSRVAFICE